MARAITAAQFVHANMPLGTTYEAPVLSVADAFDVAAYIEAQPRPHKTGLEADFPDRARKPVDAATFRRVNRILQTKATYRPSPMGVTRVAL